MHGHPLLFAKFNLTHYFLTFNWMWCTTCLSSCSQNRWMKKWRWMFTSVFRPGLFNVVWTPQNGALDKPPWNGALNTSGLDKPPWAPPEIYVLISVWWKHLQSAAAYKKKILTFLCWAIPTVMPTFFRVQVMFHAMTPPHNA